MMQELLDSGIILQREQPLDCEEVKFGFTLEESKLIDCLFTEQLSRGTRL